MTALSAVISWIIFFQFLLSPNASIREFFAQAFGTPIATLISSDIVLSYFIILVFASIELKRMGMSASRLLLYTLVTFSVGICGSLPLFLYQRERQLETLTKTI